MQVVLSFAAGVPLAPVSLGCLSNTGASFGASLRSTRTCILGGMDEPLVGMYPTQALTSGSQQVKVGPTHLENEARWVWQDRPLPPPDVVRWRR